MFRESLNRIHPHSPAPSNGHPVGLFPQSDAAKGYCLPSALEDPAPKTVRGSLSQRDRIKYLGSLVFPPLQLFFPFFFLLPSAALSGAFVEPCARSTNSSGVQPKKRQREAGGGRKAERTSGRESERVENFEICGGFPAV